MAKAKEQTTTKKVKVTGTQQYINSVTGEIQDFLVTSVEERDFNFHKVWMRSFISTLDIIGNQKTKICYWVIEHMNKENQLPYTYRQIAEATGTSLETVRITMNRLLEVNFLKRRNIGCYTINPDVVFKGTRNGRMGVVTDYYDPEKCKPISDMQRLTNLLNTINSLQKQAKELSNKIQNEQQSNKETAQENEEGAKNAQHQ